MDGRQLQCKSWFGPPPTQSFIHFLFSCKISNSVPSVFLSGFTYYNSTNIFKRYLFLFQVRIYAPVEHVNFDCTL
jgi:hypothetical protein